MIGFQYDGRQKRKNGVRTSLMSHKKNQKEAPKRRDFKIVHLGTCMSCLSRDLNCRIVIRRVFFEQSLLGGKLNQMSNYNHEAELSPSK